jgi:hypothetical protein
VGQPLLIAGRENMAPLVAAMTREWEVATHNATMAAKQVRACSLSKSLSSFLLPPVAAPWCPSDCALLQLFVVLSGMHGSLSEDSL